MSRSAQLPRWLACVALALANAAGAQQPAAPAAAGSTTVYRCGNGSYTSSPCPGGVRVDAADPRSAAQQRDARAAAAADKRLAEQLAAERRARDREVAGQKAVSVGPAAPAAAPASAASVAKKRPKPHKATARPVKPPARSASGPG